jgi:hypothetical protein
MTIGNISSKFRQIPSTHSILMVAVLRIPIKNRNLHRKRLDQQLQTHRAVLNDLLRQVLQPLTCKEDHIAEIGYYNILCANGTFRRWKPVLTAWLGDCPEYCTQHHLERHVCFWWKCPKNELGVYVPPDKQHPRWDHNLY